MANGSFASPQIVDCCILTDTILPLSGILVLMMMPGICRFDTVVVTDVGFVLFVM